MFVYALATGVREGWLPAAPYGAAARRGWRGLAAYVDDRGRVREVSHGTVARTLKPYLCNDRYPLGDDHGQAAVLWAAAAMIRLGEVAATQ
jgi:rhamnogalacturonyl hydrolase YesR